MEIFLFMGVALLVSSVFLKHSWIYIIAAAISFGTYMNVLDGNILLYALFILGVIFLVVELYVPGFGIAGITGSLATTGALYLYTNDIIYTSFLLMGSVVTGLLFAYLYTKMGKKFNLSPGFILETSLNKKSGFSSVDDYSDLIGRKGLVVSGLRPVGQALIDDVIYDVISEFEIIGVDSEVQVVRVEGSNIYVRKEKSL